MHIYALISTERDKYGKMLTTDKLDKGLTGVHCIILSIFL